MKDLKNIILEKLKINKDSKLSIKYYTDDYWYGDISEQGDMKDTFYENRKLKMNKTDEHGNLKNRPWFAVYLYLLKNGPAKTTEIREALWPGKTSQQAELFTAMRGQHIIKSNKGLQEICSFDEWIISNTNSFSSFKLF